jgi:hypothetical protein
MNKKNYLKYFIASGMLGVLFYFTHTALGHILWSEYNPITTDISSLTAVGAPNAKLLGVFTSLYAICMILFSGAMVIKAFQKYHTIVRTGYIVLLIMQLTSALGYSLFPLEGDKTIMSFQNMMHIITTAVVVLTTVVTGFLLSIGYIKQEKLKKLGSLILIFAVLITLFGSLNPFNIALGWGIMGLTERLIIYTLQIMLFIISFIYTFKEDKLK